MHDTFHVPLWLWGVALAVVLAVAYVWIGLLVGFYLPYPPSFFITAFAFVTFVAVRGLLAGVAGGRHPRSRR